MKTTGKIVTFCALAGIAVGTILFMKKDNDKTNDDGFIGRSEIVIEDGKMTPEVLLAFGRLSDPQVSPDGKLLIYGVSYTSTEDNRSCRNLYISNLDGSDRQLLTQSGKSISNARWSNNGEYVIYLKGGQIHIAGLARSTERRAVAQGMHQCSAAALPSTIG